MSTPTPRTFEASSIIQLPLLGAASAIALGTSLVTAADAMNKLPESIGRAKGVMVATLAAFKAAVASVAPPAGDPKAQGEADRTLDSAWGAFHEWVTGWSRLPGDANAAKAATAAALLALLCPNLKFTQLKYKLEWSESETRLQRVDATAAANIASLGGADFLETLRVAHKAYGEVLGITVVVDGPAPAVTVREPFDAFLGALRSYTLKVTAHADGEDEDTQAFAAALLKPLTTWESAARSGGAEEVVVAVEEGEAVGR